MGWVAIRALGICRKRDSKQWCSPDIPFVEKYSLNKIKIQDCKVNNISGLQCPCDITLPPNHLVPLSLFFIFLSVLVDPQIPRDSSLFRLIYLTLAPWIILSVASYIRLGPQACSFQTSRGSSDLIMFVLKHHKSQETNLIRIRIKGRKWFCFSVKNNSTNANQNVGFEVLTPMVMKSSVFWDKTPYSRL
jgi:hypothetical protein